MTTGAGQFAGDYASTGMQTEGVQVTPVSSSAALAEVVSEAEHNRISTGGHASSDSSGIPRNDSVENAVVQTQECVLHSPQWLILCREANAVHFYRKAGEVWTLRESCGEESSATSKHQAAIAAACQSGRPECKVLHNGEMVKLVASVMGDDALVASFPADLQSFHRDANEAAADGPLSYCENMSTIMR